MNGIEILKRLSEAEVTTEEDDAIMELMLRKTIAPKAIVTCGIVYLEGRGTIDAPPAPISMVAKALVKHLKI